MSNRAALLYDFFLVKGGAESLSLTLCQAQPRLDLCIGFIDKDCFDKPLPIEGQVTELTSVTKVLGWQSIKVSSAFESQSVAFIKSYDRVIFSGSNAPLAAKYRAGKSNVLYCHTPPRFIYDLRNFYLNNIPLWQRPLLRLLIAYIKPKYERSLGMMNLIVANSINVQQRIKKHCGKEAIVIYPPCHVDNYRWQSQGDYFLSTARVEPYKRIRLIVEAFKQMPDKKLVVASGGSELMALQASVVGYPNVSFTGWCEAEQLQQLMANCIATLYLPIDEDFGISPVESMAAGKPVIGVNEGGVKETVVPGETGILCPSDPCVSDIISAVTVMTNQLALSMRDMCEQRAQLFSSAIFNDKMGQLIDCSEQELASVAEKVDASKV